MCPPARQPPPDKAGLVFGRWLRSKRSSLGVTADDLARSAKVSHSTVVNIERGAPALKETIHRLRVALMVFRLRKLLSWN
jgi:transcriptional regulator with XRE-family HTH domain